VIGDPSYDGGEFEGCYAVAGEAVVPMRSAIMTIPRSPASPSPQPSVLRGGMKRNRLPMVRDVVRMRRQLRRLNDAYLDADNKPLVRHLIEAGLEDLRTLHDTLPENVRRTSWLLTLERHDGWGR
jgi:hypothetical protein